MAGVIVQARTLAGPKHSGQFGGAAPDALLVLLHALATLHDENGDVAVPGLRREEWTGASYSDDEFRDLAEIVPGMPFFGTGGLGERIWSGPAITVTGIDAQPVDEALNAVVPHARQARPSDPSEEDGAGAGGADPAPRGTAAVRGRAVLARGDRQGLLRENDRPCVRGPHAPPLTGSGASRRRSSRPVAPSRSSARSKQRRPMRRSCLGTTDGFANIHAPNERVLLDEFEKAVAVETEFFSRFAETFARGR